ncbi:MAG: ROK family protein [Chitinophagaceae bacterium]|nr:MAG: ROK family protein [Chitinophagaceae bacterium]
MKKGVNILAGDIGATKTLLALFNYNKDELVLIKEEKFVTKNCSDFGTVIKNFLGNERSDAVCLGIAGPVMNGKVTITNISLELNNKQLSAALDGIPVYFINDLEATAYGLSRLKGEDFSTIHEGGKNSTGNMAVIAPGTGLGEAAAWWDGKVHHPFATEGGHCDFTTRTQTDFELLNFLKEKFNHVSWERLLSGQGIINIFEFLQIKGEITIPSWLNERLMKEDAAAVISSNAHEIDICNETMELFFSYLAIESAHLALKTKATGGLFIGGGIMPKVHPLLNNQIFVKQFTDFGRLSYLLETIPVKIILNPRAALLGAAVYGAGFYDQLFL